jgi:hypothetical protein
LDSLLELVIIDDISIRQKIRSSIIYQLQNIFDYNDEHHQFVEEKILKDRRGNDINGSEYLRVKKNYISIYQDPVTQAKIPVPGIILTAEKRILRTEGVIVEALLGQASALDPYSEGLQTHAVREKELNNELKRTEIERNRLATKIIKEKDRNSAEIFEKVFPCCKPSIFSLWPPKDEETGDNL